MPLDENASEEVRQRIRDQIDIVAEEHPGAVAWDTEQREEFGYLFDPDALLVSDEGRGRVEEILNGRGDFEADVRVEPVGAEDDNQAPLGLVRVILPPRRDGQTGRVPLALEALESEGVNDGVVEATPDHWLHLSGAGNTRLCPATEPEETRLDVPWPGVVADRTRGAGVQVSVIDSGWHPASGAASAPTWWLEGVAGDDEGNGQVLRPYAGHGTFIAGVVRCLAPSAEVFVEGFIMGRAAMRESDMVRQLRQTLRLRKPQLINLSAGAVTRQDRPLLSFERFWNRNLSETENCLLVAAAGNDATRAPFWPAAFEWALGVGSLDEDGGVSDFSNWGDSADVFALGSEIVNAYPTGTYVCRETPDTGRERHFDGLARWSGTSFAAPVVVGLIAAELARSGGDVFSARDAVLSVAGRVSDPDGSQVPALFPPYV